METETICQKKFDNLRDFNLIYINNFERLAIPRIIKGNFLKRFPQKQTKSLLFFKKEVDNAELPKEILDVLKTDESYAHEGIIYKKVLDIETGEVYYDSFNDETERIDQILEIPQIKNTLNILESAVRKPALTRDFLSLPGFNAIESENGVASLSLEDDSAFEKTYTLEKNMRSCKIVLTVVKDSLIISLDLGILSYSVYRKN